MIRVSARLGALALASAQPSASQRAEAAAVEAARRTPPRACASSTTTATSRTRPCDTNVLDACGKANGVSIKREAVPGDTLIQKVLQQARPRRCRTC